MKPTLDTSNWDPIYSDTFSYYYTRNFLNRYMEGRGDGNRDLYTDEERLKLQEKTQLIFDDIVGKDPVKERVAVLTAGPYWTNRGAVLATFPEDHAYLGIATCLPHINEILPPEKNSDARRYPGMRVTTHIALANLIREGYALRLDLGWSIWKPTFCKFLQGQGYKVHLVHVTPSTEAPEETAPTVGWEKNLWDENIDDNQTLHELPQFVNQMSFYYEAEEGKPHLAATYKLGKVEVVDPASYESIQAFHDKRTGGRQWPL